MEAGLTRQELNTELRAVRRACVAARMQSLSTDVCGPITELPAVIAAMRTELASAEILAPLHGHVGDGNFHLVMLFNPDSPAEVEHVRRLHGRLITMAIAHGGTITGEHGVGLGKNPYMEAEHGAALDVMRDIKRALDPRNILNPSKISTFDRRGATSLRSRTARHLEKRIRPDHPLRTIRAVVDEALASLEHHFGDLYAEIGRPSISPEQLLRAMLLQVFFSVRSELQLMERIDYDLLFRWFVGLGIDDAVWNASTSSKNRDRLLEAEIAARFLSAILAIPCVKRLLSSEHFTVDGSVTRHRGYAISQVIRKRIEEAFVWGKEVGPLRRIRARGRPGSTWRSA